MSSTGKVALVTGAAQGLGKAFCEILLKNGAKVALTDFNKDVGEKTLKEFEAKYGQNRVIFLQCDVSNMAQMEETFKKVKESQGGLDIVINNAGVGGEMGDQWIKTIDINVKGTIKGTMLGIDLMRKDKGGNGGVIVNLSSMSALNPNPCGPVYSATKSAIICFSQAWSRNPELAQNGVRVNVLAPAFADTQLVQSLINGQTQTYAPAIQKVFFEKAGIMTPETVAEALYELVDDQNKTGAVLKISQAGGKDYVTS
ncbi:15-hydroxyprostaglandin dehydrogenase [NAD(+)]-like [Physella acuta]|uniref:15-hydroxyprostaglandin dehydrogenase [NAD(+)]-like n=1 Tax=Physella acuta TaxID=109671 RepID=UPI0027DAE960|nr:15-hydroxyprostaglandin dehydrogenase [NAD(+)]-like [Physella acuta]XP_059152453.1 15-hydroxyprostaglandin dehydrogenase [NAD(+)]-like [Physella acuta]XP_059152454.1 15-hydroxyprostaglandin dehydrogenase [NAD(+)]-like [Physella acuta]XP_059152455.1 15-hydroxyprostaglandin dehydrogenase [NAD(+)]-like [Physella acuta]